jgi:hypothetical protein
VAPADQRDLTARVLLAEYEQLKQEQRDRMGLRDNLVYAGLGAQAAVVAAIVTGRGGTALLLLLPPVAALLGWTRLMNDLKVSSIRRYIRSGLTSQLTALAGDAPTLFGWETGDDPRRRVRKCGQLAHDLTAFTLLPLSALVGFWVTGPYPLVLLAVSVLDVALTVALAGEIVRYADLAAGPGRAKGPVT